MSTRAQAVWEQIRALPISDQRSLWHELGQQIAQASSPASAQLHGEPLTDEDIEQSARVTFHMLDEEEDRAGSR